MSISLIFDGLMFYSALVLLVQGLVVYNLLIRNCLCTEKPWRLQTYKTYSSMYNLQELNGFAAQTNWERG